LLQGLAARRALVQLGRLLRTLFLADYAVNVAFGRELPRVLNRGESVNSLKALDLRRSRGRLREAADVGAD